MISKTTNTVYRLSQGHVYPGTDPIQASTSDTFITVEIPRSQIIVVIILVSLPSLPNPQLH